tara:strand:+ start:15687 stop:17390 length:1704 start_codon:yes stop_codon:yes gene_type:complete
MILSEMKVVLTASTSAFATAMDKAGGKVKKFRKGAGKVAGSMKAFGIQAAAAAAVVSGLAWGAKKVFDLGASIAETGSKFNTVFGSEAGAKVSTFLDNFANKAGLTTNEAKGLVATAGAITQGLGFTQKASGDTAIAMTKLAGDLSSFNNIPTADTMHAISSALTGEREQLKALGIVVQEADVQQQAFANTGKTVAANLTAQEKATATLQLITEKAGSAVGDLNRTQGSAANVAKRLVARFKEIRDAIATALMPAFTQVLRGLEDNEGKFIDFKQAIIDNTGVISAWAIVAIKAFQMVGEILKVPVIMFKNLVDQLMVGWTLLKSIATLDFAGVTDAMIEGWGNLKDVASSVVDVWDSGVAVVDAIGDAVGGANEAFLALQVQVNDTAADLELLDPPVTTATKSVMNLSEKMEELGESISKNFVGRMEDAAQGGKESFSGFFAYMKKQLIALAMRALFFQAIMGIGKKLGLDMEKVGGFATSMTGFSPATGGGDTGDAGAGTPILSGRAAGGSPRGMIVNQNIHFEVSAIDGRDAARFIKEQGGTIAEVIAKAAKDSTGFRRQLQGA